LPTTPLGERGGAAGVEVADRVPVRHEALRLGVAALAKIGKPEPVARTGRASSLRPRCHDDIGDALGLGKRLGQRREQLRLDDDATGSAVPEDVADLVAAPAEVERHADHAELGARVVGDEELDAVPGGQRERVAAPVAAFREPVREPVDQAVELPVGEPPAGLDQRGRVRVAGRGPGQAVADVDALDEVALDFR
jgi:hypothetical protein